MIPVPVKAILRQERDILSGIVNLPVSKSILNRSQIIHAISDLNLHVPDDEAGEDTHRLYEMLSSVDAKRYAGDGGTALRFMLAYSCFKNQAVEIYGSDSLNRRPIGALVDALRKLGAKIEYVANEGFPPVRILSVDSFPNSNKVKIESGISSQFITALLLIAPCLQEGLIIEWDDEPVSYSYIELTIAMMKYCGVDVKQIENGLNVKPGKYERMPVIEKDWSAASYFFALLAQQPSGELLLKGLSLESVQPDIKTVSIFHSLAVEAFSVNDGVWIRKGKVNSISKQEFSFLSCPDIAQTFSVAAAALGVDTRMSGLKTLRIKETDRIAGLQTELAKTGVEMEIVVEDNRDVVVMQKGTAIIRDALEFNTYQDHRMAMALSVFSTKGEITILDPMVINKSFPTFFEECKKIGIDVAFV